MIFDFVESAPHYFGISALLDEGLKTIASVDFSALEPGRRQETGTGIYYMVMEPALHPFAQTRWERHERYIDIQFALSDGEQIGCLPVREIGDWGPTDARKDIAFAADGRAGCVLTMRQGMFAVLFPSDAHRPCIAVPGAERTRKVVVKVPVR